MERGAQGRRGRRFDAQGSEVKPRVCQGHGALDAVVVEGEAQKLGRDWARLDLVETRQSSDKIVEVVAILKSSTAETKAIEQVKWWKRQGMRVLIKPEEDRRETRRRLESLPASFRPYMVWSILKTMNRFPEVTVLRKGKRERRERTTGGKFRRQFE